MVGSVERGSKGSNGFVDLRRGLIHTQQTPARILVRATPLDGKKTRLVFQEPQTEQARRTMPLPSDIVEELQRHKTQQA
jgi:hypothetical protein